jgi:SAM-dependent methyltransferase
MPAEPLTLPRCPVCDGAAGRSLVTIPQAPVHLHLLQSDRDAAIAVPRGDIQLLFCPDCGHLWNGSFRSELVSYEGIYENSLHFSPKFQEYANNLAVHLVKRFSLYEKDVVEIGSGRGEFLQLLCDLGNNRGVGFEPSAAAETAATQPHLRLVRRALTTEHAGLPLDFVCCRHTLEHMADPRAFVRTLREVIGPRAGVGLYFEVPDGGYMLRDLALWDLIYEHVSYFTAPSLTRLFVQEGFAVTAVYGAFGEQFLCLEATTGPGPGLQPEVDRPAELAGQAARFAARYAATVRFWQERMQAWAQAGRRVVVWGAGSKAISFLNQMADAEAVACVVDINPRKHGMFISGTGHPIVPPAFLREYRPEVVLVMNPQYRAEIATMLAQAGVMTRTGGTPELIVVGEAGTDGV